MNKMEINFGEVKKYHPDAYNPGEIGQFDFYPLKEMREDTPAPDSMLKKPGKKTARKVVKRKGSNCRLVKDTNTGKIYDTIKEASIAAGMIYGTFYNQVHGQNKNYTGFILLERERKVLN